MIGATVGMAAAASYPAPFVQSGAANVAIVVGGADAAATDGIAATNIYASLSGSVVSDSSGTPVVSGTAWQVATSSDKLEISENISAITGFIDDADLSILADGAISNEKGTAKYNQKFYFDATSPSVVYAEDDDENIGLWLKATDGENIARYVMHFTTSLRSDTNSAGSYPDIEDKEISILGKPYSIVTAANGSTAVATDADVELTLMSGAAKGTIGNDEELTVGGRTVSAVISSATQAQFTVDGETLNEKLDDGGMGALNDGTYIGVTDITYQDYAGGIQQATFFLGADKIELKNGSSLVVNSITVDNAAVEIESSISGGDVSITDIKVNMTAEEDLYVAIDGKLSENSELNEPEVLITNNWDLEFKGLKTHNEEELTLKPTSSDARYQLDFINYDGNAVTLPLMLSNASGVFGGEKADYRFIFSPQGDLTDENITDNDYFILNTADPRTSAGNARSYVVQYKGSDAYAADTEPKYKFNVWGEEGDMITKNVDMDATGGGTLDLNGGDFTIDNLEAVTSKDVSIVFTNQDYASGGDQAAVSCYARTQYNALINITDGLRNMTNMSAGGSEAGMIAGVAWTVNVSLDDADRDGDTLNLATEQQIFFISLVNDSDDEIASSLTGTTDWITDTVDSDLSKYMTTYGAYIESVDTSSAPASLTVTIPESIVEPLVYVSSGDITVSTVVGGTSGMITVQDSEASAESSKNLLVIGGSCINSVAAALLGGALCGDAFTTKTGVGAGEYLIETFASPYSSDKVAMLVAGYNAPDTTKAATALVNSAIDTSVGKKYVSADSTVTESNLIAVV